MKWCSNNYCVCYKPVLDLGTRLWAGSFYDLFSDSLVQLSDFLVDRGAVIISRNSSDGKTNIHVLYDFVTGQESKTEDYVI